MCPKNLSAVLSCNNFRSINAKNLQAVALQCLLIVLLLLFTFVIFEFCFDFLVSEHCLSM